MWTNPPTLDQKKKPYSLEHQYTKENTFVLTVQHNTILSGRQNF